MDMNDVYTSRTRKSNFDVYFGFPAPPALLADESTSDV